MGTLGDRDWHVSAAPPSTATGSSDHPTAPRQQHVPYRIESGWLVLPTQEVRDLFSCLRAIDDPSDQVALVAALRSPAYGCSDVDLLHWIDDGRRFDSNAHSVTQTVRSAARSSRSERSTRTG